MSRSESKSRSFFRTGWRFATPALLAIALLSGCEWNKLRGEGFPKDDTSNWVGGMRQRDKDKEIWSFSEKGREIERSLGVTGE